MNDRDDRIFRSTRWVAAAVVPILLLAWVILYLFPGETGTRFAWEIKPSLTAMYMGAGYLGGGYLFLHAALGRRWHRVAAGFPAVAIFTLVMLLATILHRERFDLGHFPAQLWLLLYVITPLLIPWLWWRNRRTDPGTPEPDDVVMPRAARYVAGALGAGLLAAGVVSFLAPSWLIGFWPWTLTPLTARVLAGWALLMGVGNVGVARESRWSGWRPGMESIALWHALVLAGSVAYREEFTTGLVNWYTASVITVLVGIAALYLRMEGRRRRARMIPAPA